MGTIAAVQVRGRAVESGRFVESVRSWFAEVADALNAHVPTSELSRLAKLSEAEALEKCAVRMRPCYEAAFALSKASGGAFNPRWKGTGTLDFGAIAKGFAVDLAATGAEVEGDGLIDLGGNVKSVRGNWRTGVRDPNGDGFAAYVELREGESLATSATYYRGGHIFDGRTGCVVSNGVASVTVLCDSAMWADGLSTTLFVLGPAAGRAFLDNKLPELLGDCRVSVLWIMSDGARTEYGNARFQGN